MTRTKTDRMLTRQQAAAYLGVAVNTLEKWAAAPRGQERIPYYKHGTARNAPVRYRLSDLDKYLAANRHEPRSVS